MSFIVLARSSILSTEEVCSGKGVRDGKTGINFVNSVNYVTFSAIFVTFVNLRKYRYLFRYFRYRFTTFINQNEEEPVAGPQGEDLNEAVMVASDEEDDFFAAAEALSQQVEEVQPTHGLLGLEGPVTPLKIELENYLNLPRLPNSKVNILLWWKDHQHQFPLLAQAARKYLCITVSSAPSERLFSASGNFNSVNFFNVRNNRSFNRYFRYYRN